jgi:serine/threonine protein kinase
VRAPPSKGTLVGNEVAVDEPEDSREDASVSPFSREADPSFLLLLRQALGGHPHGLKKLDVEASPSVDTPLVERIGRFEVIEVLGRGGYGTVLRVRDLKLGCERAMKLPNPETLASPRALARFMDEARKAVRIDHPNVVRVLEADEVFSLYYMVMEYCPGGSLSGWLAHRPIDRPIPPRWAASLLAEIADGVQQAHAAGLLHRDLKPGNVMLVRVDDRNESDPPQFHPKVGDFGLAKALFDSPNQADRTVSGTMIGTLAYMSPEQARGDKAIGEASDIYGLGAILYEVLTRSTPYPGSSEAEVFARILDDAPPPSPRSLRPDLPRDLETICRTALAKRPGDRYATAALLADDLRRFLRNDPVKGSPWWKRARAGLRRRRAHVLIGVPALLLTISVGLTLEARSRNNASAWLAKLGNTSLDDLPRMIADRDPPDWRVRSELDAVFDHGDERRKLAASLALAGSRSDCAKFATDHLLAAPPESLAPIARMLRGKVPKLLDVLEEETRTPAKGAQERSDTSDRRRSNAAAALVLLDRPEPGFRLLEFSADCHLRTFFIHVLGPSGVSPVAILERLGHEEDLGVFRALILCLGEIPEKTWSSDLRRQATDMLLQLYERHPDSGVHGACKWVITRWERAIPGEFDRTRPLVAINQRIANRSGDQQMSWRINRTGMTLIRIDAPDLDRVVEIADTETSRELFRQFRDKHPHSLEVGPDANGPVNSIDEKDAFDFCEWLGTCERIAAVDRCHASTRGKVFDTVSGWTRKTGYRLMTLKEFEIAARGGTKTTRYLGDSPAFLDKYARYPKATELDSAMIAVASLKPNDLGFFDLLGNAPELVIDEFVDQRDLRIHLAGGSTHASEDQSRATQSIQPSVSLSLIKKYLGFRVARTVFLKNRPLATPAP